MVFPETVLSLFTTDPTLVGNSIDSLRAVALAVAIVIPADMFFNAVAGTGDTPAVLFIEIALSICIIGLAYSFMLLLGWPIATVWLAEAAGWILCLMLSSAWLRCRRWERRHI
jgi:Na+-driven multidrug efflux pump